MLKHTNLLLYGNEKFKNFGLLIKLYADKTCEKRPLNPNFYPLRVSHMPPPSHLSLVWANKSFLRHHTN